MDYWEKTVNDIKGALGVFIMSVFGIWFALEIVKAFFPSFPLTTDSNWIISIVLGLFLVLVKYINKKNRH